MKSSEGSVCALIAVLLSLTCTVSSQSTPYHQEFELERLAIANNIFTKNLLQILPHDKNIIFSPLTISTSLEMLYLGARKGTAREISEVLQHEAAGLVSSVEVHKDFQKLQAYLQRDSKYALDYTNAIVIQENFNVSKGYKRRLKKYYQTEIRKADFAGSPDTAMELINQWVSQATNNKISQLLTEPLDSLTKLFIMSAVYFKGLWKAPFDKRWTTMAPFYKQGRVPVDVPMMNKYGAKLLYGRDENNGISIVDVPYRGGDFSMVIILPDDREGLSSPEGLNTILNTIFAANSRLTVTLAELLYETTVDISLPKFRVEGSYDLVNPLKSLGMKKAFELDEANLQGMVDKNGTAELHVGKVMHKAIIEVSEEGTEASAVSGITIEGRSASPPSIKFRADHPFLYFIRDVQSGIIIFAGRVNEF